MKADASTQSFESSSTTSTVAPTSSVHQSSVASHQDSTISANAETEELTTGGGEATHSTGKTVIVNVDATQTVSEESHEKAIPTIAEIPAAPTVTRSKGEYKGSSVQHGGSMGNENTGTTTISAH